MNNDNAIIIGSMAIIALSGTVRNLMVGKSPFKPIVGALGGLVVLGGVATVAPQIAKGLAIVGALSVFMIYAPDILAIWNNSLPTGGKDEKQSRFQPKGPPELPRR